MRFWFLHDFVDLVWTRLPGTKSKTLSISHRGRALERPRTQNTWKVRRFCRQLSCATNPSFVSDQDFLCRIQNLHTWSVVVSWMGSRNWEQIRQKRDTRHTVQISLLHRTAHGIFGCSPCLLLEEIWEAEESEWWYVQVRTVPGTGTRRLEVRIFNILPRGSWRRISLCYYKKYWEADLSGK